MILTLEGSGRGCGSRQPRSWAWEGLASCLPGMRREPSTSSEQAGTS